MSKEIYESLVNAIVMVVNTQDGSAGEKAQMVRDAFADSDQSGDLEEFLCWFEE